MNATDRQLLMAGHKMIWGVYRPRFAIRGTLRLAPSLFVQYRAKDPRTGKSHMVRENTHTLSISETQKLRASRKRDLERGAVTGPLADRITFDNLGDGLIADYTARERRSIRRVHIALSHLRGNFADWRATAITTQAVNDYIVRRRSEGAAVASINRELGMLRRMFNLCEKLPSRPKIQLLPEHNRREGFFEQAQVEALAKHLPDHLRASIWTGFITGWRIRSELLTREKRHVHWKNVWLILEDGEGKSRQPCRFPLTVELRAVLQEQLEHSRELENAHTILIPWLFHRDDGTPIWDFRHAWKSACKKAGLQGRIPHDFRRSAVRNLERSGVPRSAAMKMVGHKTESVYRRYAIADEAVLRDAALRLSALHRADAARPGHVPTPISEAVDL